MQHRQRHMCSEPSGRVLGYPASMQPEQKIIADWILRTLEEKGWTFADWAHAAKTTPTNISRAVKDDYKSVTSVRTLVQLAEAAGKPTVLDFLAADGSNAQPSQDAPAPSVEAVAMLLNAVVPLLPRGRMTVESQRVVAAALVHGLQLLGTSAASSDPQVLAVGARGAGSRLRDLTRQ